MGKFGFWSRVRGVGFRRMSLDPLEWGRKDGVRSAGRYGAVFLLSFFLIALTPLKSLADAIDALKQNYSAPAVTVDAPTLAPTGTTGADCDTDMAAAADKALQMKSALIDKFVAAAPKSISQMPCYAKYQNLSIASAVGVPDLSTLLGQLMQQACNAVDSAVANAVAPINKSLLIPVPGGGFSVNTGVAFGQSSGNATPFQAPAVGSTPVTLPKLFN